MKRIAFLLGLFLLGSVMLAACGDEKAEVPKYAGATALTVPATIQTQFSNAFSSDAKFRNSKVEAYKSADAPDKIKTGLVDAFSKEGWQDILNDVRKSGGEEAIKTFESMGGFIISYAKGNKGAVAMSFPGAAAGPLGFTDVGANDTIFLVVSGNG